MLEGCNAATSSTDDAHRSNRFWELALSLPPRTAVHVLLPSQLGLSQGRPSCSPPEARVHCAARVAASSHKKECGDCERVGVTATQERPNGTSLQPETTTKPGRRVVITMQRPYWDGRCLALERTEFQLLQGSNKCRSAAVWCLCFSVRHPGRPTSDETPSPALRVDAMQPVLGHKPSAMHILPSAFIVLCRNISRPICGLFVRIRSRLRRSGPRSAS